MPQHHISRKDLKKDEFREKLTHGAEAIRSHQGLTGIVAAALIVIALGVGGWRLYSQSQAAHASSSLDDALKIYDARIRTASEPAQPSELTYLDEKTKYQDAVKKFDDVAVRYGHTRPGQQALYYAATCYEHLGQSAQAEKDLQSLIDENGDLTPLAKFELAQVYAKSGKSQQAAQLYQQLIGAPTVLVPKPFVMLSLADLYSQTNPPEATKLLNQIKTEFPNSPAADEAQKRLEIPALPGHP
ncbi:MAG TPA: tetratricopeptide repeat protein [Candidatus Acidoferrales bacterium]|nr:tetratricopeptide repeat protein [Candidatus Acidoferrales bacterium]